MTAHSARAHARLAPSAAHRWMACPGSVRATEGMVSEIGESIYPEYISIHHLGMISNGVIDTTSDEVKAWAPSYENYTLEKVGDHQTRFALDMDINEEHYDMFMGIWPKALGLMKEIAEG